MSDTPRVETFPPTVISNHCPTISLSALVIDEHYQARSNMHVEVIDEYAEVIKQAECWPFPPIKVVSQIVVDGFHRIQSAKRVIADPGTSEQLRKQLQDIPCERISVNPTSEDVRDVALRHALAANHTHGLRRSNEDKRRSVRLALLQWPDASNRSIAKLTFTSHPFVNALRNESQVETFPHQLETEQQDNEQAEVKNGVETFPLEENSDLSQSSSRPRKSASPHKTRSETKASLDKPKDYWGMAVEALSDVSKRLTDCKNIYAIDEQEYRSVYEKLYRVDEGIAWLKQRYDCKRETEDGK